MEEERIQVLQMVADGRITAEQGNELLDALRSDEPREPSYRYETRVITRPREERRERNKRLQALTRAKIHGVSSEYIEQMRQAGFDAPLKDMIHARVSGVTPEYVADLRNAGFEGLTLREISSARLHGVDADYVRDMSGFVGTDDDGDNDDDD